LEVDQLWDIDVDPMSDTNVGLTRIMTLSQCYNVTSNRQIDKVIPMMDQPMVAVWDN